MIGTVDPESSKFRLDSQRPNTNYISLNKKSVHNIYKSMRSVNTGKSNAPLDKTSNKWKSVERSISKELLILNDIKKELTKQHFFDGKDKMDLEIYLSKYRNMLLKV